jgi:hypothetical protein
LPCRRSRVRVPSSACTKAPPRRGFLVPDARGLADLLPELSPENGSGVPAAVLARARVAGIDACRRPARSERLRVLASRPQAAAPERLALTAPAQVVAGAVCQRFGGTIIRVSGFESLLRHRRKDPQRRVCGRTRAGGRALAERLREANRSGRDGCFHFVSTWRCVLQPLLSVDVSE